LALHPRRSIRFFGGGSAMAQRQRPEIAPGDVQGLKYFQILAPFLERLRDCQTARDRAGNRELHFDQYVALILLYYFNPVVTGLRSLQQASRLGKVQRLLGCGRASLGSLSEASHVFDPELLHSIIGELAKQVIPITVGKDKEALRGLTAVDGTLLPALPKMAWALWKEDGQNAAKIHVQFDVLKGVPIEATLTVGNGSERQELRNTLQPGRFYVADRGYIDYQLFQDILDVGSSFLVRVKENTAFDVLEERPLSPEAIAAGVVRDVVVKRLGTDHHKNVLKQPVRLVFVQTGKADSSNSLLILATDRMDLDAELVALGYRYRWSVELFFRWFKCILGCRHLLSQNPNGITIQVYLGIIASLLISLWTGKKPTKRTLEMIQFFFCGMATEEELLAHIKSLKDHD
jgi:Transposase DDE domain